jgi:outer membrane biosynthesis protein TonB
LTLAFAGPGETTIENAKALLNDFVGLGPEDADGFPAIPDDDVLDLRLIFPATPDHLTDGVETVLEWTDYADLAYDVIVGEEKDRAVRKAAKHAENEIEATNVNEALIKELKQAEGEAYLILLWGEEGEEPDENAEVLLDLASSYDIKALDLTAGLDDIGFGDEDSSSEPEPEPEPEPEEEKPARGSRRRSKPEPEEEPEEEKPTRGRRRSLEAEEKPLEDKPEPDPEPEQKPTRSRRKTTPEPEPEDDSDSLDTQVAKARHAHNPQTDEEITNGQIKGIAAKQAAKARSIAPEIIHRFSFHPANADTAPKHEAVRSLAIEFAGALDALLPEGREKSLVLTKIEEAMFWANASIARGGATAGPEKPQDEPVQEDAQEAAEEPVRGRGRPRRDGSPAQPRAAADKAVMEYYDEDAEEWVKKGRGRPPKDAKTRLVDPKTGDVVED